MIPIDFTVLIQAITGIVNPTAMLRNKLERNETVIRLLKQFNLSPDSPPADFSGVYAYTLIEYGVGKPKVVLELFRQPEIRQALQAAWGQDNFSVLLQVGEGFLEGAALGHELRALGIDARQEFYQFATVFIAIAKRTRTPADILTTQQLNSLHRQIAQVQDRLERLPTIEGIRTEMARLTAQPFLALPEGSVSEQCRAFALAQQMRGWFETLDYRFEPYEQWQADGFEWIINIPVRRGRYDRILVRGIDGEAELRDVIALRQSVAAMQTDEGWLVTSRRISRAARDEVEKPENRHLDCYTFDELVDLDADFTGYIDWLDAEIKRRKIDSRYVPLGCTKDEIDPDTQQRLGVSRYDERDGWIDGYLDRWLDDPAKEHISVLGEFGTGKTWVAFHYAWTALQRYQEAKERGVQRPRLPLVITLCDYAKALNVENVLAGFFFTQHNIRLNSEVFDQLNRMGKLLLIFDGFDEMAAKVDKQQMINNFWELAKVVVPGAKVILTCRTEHFPDAREGRALLNAQLKASTSNLTGETPQFEVLELEKFNDEQIRQVMSFQASMPTVEQVISNLQLLDLARRPVMTELILEALPEIEAGKPVDMSRVYLYAVRRKMERDIKAERTFTSLADKLYFLCELSWEMLSSDRMSLNYREFPDRIRRLFGSAVQEEKDLDHWHYDMMGQTMLIRNAEGDYTPAHRSLLEFFVAYKFAAELGILAPDFLELARRRSSLDENTQSKEYTWSDYFLCNVDVNGKVVPVPMLQDFVSEKLESLRSTFGQALLSKAVIDLLNPMINSQKPLLKVLELTSGKTEIDVGYVGGNTATLLIKLDKTGLSGKDLSHTVIQGADFSEAILHLTNFTGASLKHTNFRRNFVDIWSSALTPDGKLLATGHMNGEIRLWRFEDSEIVSAWKGHLDAIQSIDFSPNGKILASASNDHTIRLWNINTAQCLRTFQEAKNVMIRTVAFSPNSTILASGSDDCAIKLWDIETGECLKTLSGHTNEVRAVIFSGNGQLLVSGSRDHTIKVWDVKTGEATKVFQGHTNCIRSVAISPSGQTLASSGDDQSIRLWDIQAGECFRILEGHEGSVWTVRFSDEKVIVSGSRDQTVRLWDAETGQCLRSLKGHTNWVRTVTVNSNGRTLASGGDDQTVRIWNTDTGQCIKTLSGYTNWFWSISISPDGLIIASGSHDGIVRLWNSATGECIGNLQGHSNFVYSVAFHPSSQILASGSDDETIKLWNVKTGQCLKTLRGHSNLVTSVAFSPDGQLLASSSDDRTIKLWDLESGQCIRTFEEHTNRVYSVAFSPDGQTLASASFDTTIKLWRIHSATCLVTLQGHTNWVQSVIFSPDGRNLASCSFDKTIKLWSVDTYQCLNTFDGHTKWICAVTFAPDGQTLASCSDDGTVRLWNLNTGQYLKSLCQHSMRVSAIAFSSNGQTIFSCSHDETIKLWDVKSGNCLRTIKNIKPYEGMNIMGIRGLTEIEKGTLKALGAIDKSQSSTTL